jgi:hypothetical protein
VGANVGRWAKLCLVAVLSVAVFGGTWWLLQVGGKVDAGTALGVAAVPFTIAITIGGAWAEETRDERASSIEDTIRSSGTTWPDPSSIRGLKDYRDAFRRTWIAAGTPSDEETELRTGGLVPGHDVRRLREGYKESSRWRPSELDLDSALIVLQSWHVPEFLVSAWREAGPRAIRGEPKQRELAARAARAKDRKLFHPHWFLGVLTAALFLPTVFFFAGTGYSQIDTGAPLGAVNWIALVISSIILFIVLIMGLFGLIPDGRYIGKVAGRSRFAVFACCTASVILGLRFNHGLHDISELRHIGPHARNWLIWRF